MTANVGQANGIWFLDDLFAVLRRGLFNQLVVQALMRSFEVIMISELRAQHIHVRATENYEVVQAFLCDALDKSLDVSYHVW